jgi:hypothetical protein
LCVVDVDRRRKICREELQLEPAVATDDPDAPALPLGRDDSLMPVDLDSERPRGDLEPVAAEHERDRHAREAL